MKKGSEHVPVLLTETLSVLSLKDNSTVIDCTLGGGGHARAILEILSDRGKYVGIDADPEAISRQQELERYRAEVHLVNDNFANLKAIAERLDLRPDAILADLGWRSDQFESGGRGFSFLKDEPLLMTFGDPKTHLFTADDVVNGWEESSLSDIIYGYGEERFARRIAKAIVAEREKGRIETSTRLADIVTAAVPKFLGRGRIHPATKTFQAIRIAVNDELGVLSRLLADGFDILKPKGRLAVISFHSLEDRLVKQFFNQEVQAGTALKLIKKPIIASDEERSKNPRSRSAKLRVIEKL